MQKMILMVCRRYWPGVGGVERHVAGLARELIKRGQKIMVVTEQAEKAWKLNEVHEGVKIWRIPYPALASKLGIWTWVNQHAELFKTADVIHIHDVFWWYLPLRIKYANKPVYTTFHGYEGDDLPRWQAVWHRKLVEKLSRGTICVGSFMRKWYRAKPTLITYGAAESKPTPLPHSRSAVFVGRLAEDTGIMTYLKVIEAGGKRITLDIYGEGPDREAAEKYIAAQQLPAAIHGWTDKPNRAISKARYAFVSRYLAIIEAMQTKRLVVAVYNNEIKKDYLTGHPMAELMIIGDEPRDIAGRLMELKPETEKAMINRAYRWARAQTWDKLTDEYQALWQN